MSFREQAEAIRDKIVEYRRHVHMYPELGLREFETAKYIKSKLSALGIEYQTCTDQTYHQTAPTVKAPALLDELLCLLCLKLEIYIGSRILILDILTPFPAI